jgi:uncharacterized membrane protein (GlpM family)
LSNIFKRSNFLDLFNFLKSNFFLQKANRIINRKISPNLIQDPIRHMLNANFKGILSTITNRSRRRRIIQLDDLGCDGMTAGSLVLRFLIGGSAVAAATLIGRKMGGRIGGIFAAFPAVYGSAMVAAVIGLSEPDAVEQTMALSRGALIGMIVNVGCALAAGVLIARLGWKRGLFIALSGWVVVATLIFTGGAAWGWLK